MNRGSVAIPIAAVSRTGLSSSRICLRLSLRRRGKQAATWTCPAKFECERRIRSRPSSARLPRSARLARLGSPEPEGRPRAERSCETRDQPVCVTARLWPLPLTAIREIRAQYPSSFSRPVFCGHH
eukprot:scaffold54322_cov74-Phaeocystis_antarctica.AAC.7